MRRFELQTLIDCSFHESGVTFFFPYRRDKGRQCSATRMRLSSALTTPVPNNQSYEPHIFDGGNLLTFLGTDHHQASQGCLRASRMEL
jgi:hypothetical protein